MCLQQFPWNGFFKSQTSLDSYGLTETLNWEIGNGFNVKPTTNNNSDNKHNKNSNKYKTPSHVGHM